MSCLSNAVTLDCCNLLPNRFTKGDLYAVDANGTIQALAIGTNGKVLTADTTKPLGMDWEAAPGISGLTTGFMPIATSATTLGNSPISFRNLTGLTWGSPTAIFNVAVPASDFSFLTIEFSISTVIASDVFVRAGQVSLNTATNDGATYLTTSPLGVLYTVSNGTGTGSITATALFTATSVIGGQVQISANPSAAIITPTTYNLSYRIININGKVVSYIL